MVAAALTKLFPVKFLERIHLRPDGVFVHQLRLNGVPPLVVGGLKLAQRFGMLGGNVVLFARVGLHVEELPLFRAGFRIANQMPASFCGRCNARILTGRPGRAPSDPDG